MNDCDQTCNGLRSEIRHLSDYTTEMDSEARCIFTEKQVINENQPFYVFPSGFVVLESALKKEVMPYLNEKQREHLEAIEKELDEVKNHMKNSAGTNDTEVQDGIYYAYRMEELQYELDGLIAAECPLTGSIMIDSIDRCFCDIKEDELYIASDSLVLEA